MDLKTELFIIGQQPISGCRGWHTGDLFKAIIDNCDTAIKSGAAGNPMVIMAHAFSYGVIQGKRVERARRRGQKLVIDPPKEDNEKQLAEMFAEIGEMSIDEIKQIRDLVMAEIPQEKKAAQALNQIINDIIKEKEKEGTV